MFQYGTVVYSILMDIVTSLVLRNSYSYDKAQMSSGYCLATLTEQACMW